MKPSAQKTTPVRYEKSDDGRDGPERGKSEPSPSQRKRPLRPDSNTPERLIGAGAGEKRPPFGKSFKHDMHGAAGSHEESHKSLGGARAAIEQGLPEECERVEPRAHR